MRIVIRRGVIRVQRQVGHRWVLGEIGKVAVDPGEGRVAYSKYRISGAAHCSVCGMVAMASFEVPVLRVLMASDVTGLQREGVMEALQEMKVPECVSI